MIVRPDGAFHGTIGGGRLEWEMLRAARDALSRGRGPALFLDQALGPDLGQCCGGWVRVLVETFDGRDAGELAALAEAEGESKEIACSLDADGRVARQPSPPEGEGQPAEGREGEGAVRAGMSSPPPHWDRSGVGGSAGRGEAMSPARARFRRDGIATPSQPPPAAGPSPRRGGERDSGLDGPLSLPAFGRLSLPLQGGGQGWRESVSTRPTSLLLFGAGHVGRALVLALAPLPFAIRWIDPREGAHPSHIPSTVTPILTATPEAEIAAAPAHAFVLVMTHEHALDLAITAAALARGFPYLGLIGSATKRARFESRFRALGLPEARVRSLVCPIGIPGIEGREPAVIAAATVAQLLLERERLSSSPAAGPDPIDESHDRAHA